MDKIFECVSFLLIKNDQILLEQRSPFKESFKNATHRPYELKWRRPCPTLSLSGFDQYANRFRNVARALVDFTDNSFGFRDLLITGLDHVLKCLHGCQR